MNNAPEHDALSNRLRLAYRSGTTIPDMIRGEPEFAKKSPSEVMLHFMTAFRVGLTDVACIDGWWPPDSPSEVSDDNLDLFVRESIEAHRSAWDAGP